MKLPNGVWTKCYKIMCIEDGRFFSSNSNFSHVISYTANPLYKLPSHILEYKLGEITVPEYGKLFGVSKPGFYSCVFQGLGLNVEVGPIYVGNWYSARAMKAFWKNYAWKSQHDTTTTRHNPYVASIIMDAFLPLEKIT